MNCIKKLVTKNGRKTENFENHFSRIKLDDTYNLNKLVVDFFFFLELCYVILFCLEKQ